MEPQALRQLISRYGHTAKSAAEEIGANPNQFRDWTNGRRPVPSWALAKLEHLTDRAPGGRRWSPAEIERPAEAKPRAPALATRRKRRGERPLKFVAPESMRGAHPRPAPIETKSPSIIDLVEYVVSALPAPQLPSMNPVSSTGRALPATVPAPSLPAVIPRPLASEARQSLPAVIGDPRRLSALAPGVSLPYPDFWRGDLPGLLYRVICSAAVTIREDGGTLVAGHCGRRADPGSHLCVEHLAREVERVAASGGFVSRTQSRPLGPSAIRVKSRPPAYS